MGLLMLVFLGGVIILVIYINTLIINEKIFSVKLTKLLSVILIRRFFFFFRKNTFYKISINRFRAIIIYEKINFFFISFHKNNLRHHSRFPLISLAYNRFSPHPC